MIQKIKAWWLMKKIGAKNAWIEMKFKLRTIDDQAEAYMKEAGFETLKSRKERLEREASE